MNDRCTQITIILLALLVGWFGHDALKVEEATAQSEVVNVQPAALRQFSECFAVSSWLINGRNLNNGETPRQTVQIPDGWTPIGGGSRGAGGEGVFILCR